ncbi:MAG: glycosyltransferase family 4 protein [Solirubrobacterales bacterium]|nr:glycosyltransferase family 4 protein [Solirubrobacterales bacterium]
MRPEGPVDEGERLRILHVVDHVRNVGNGIVNVVVDLACAQSAAGDEVGIASAGGDYEPLLRTHGVRHHQVVREDSPTGRARLVRRLGGVIREVRPDVLNAHRPYATVAGRLLRPLHRSALIATDHNEFEAKGRWLRLADLIIAVSEGAAGSLAGGGVDRERIRVVQNGPLFGARRSLVAESERAPLERPAIVTVAGLVERKGVHVLLAAFEIVAASNPEVHLYFVGDGPERAALEEKRRASAFAGRIHVEGFRPDPGAHLRGADVFVLASFRDPFPLAVLEARGAGCAVVVTSVDGLPEAVDGGHAGIIVPPGDADTLAAALRSLFACDGELARWRERASCDLGRFSTERMARDTADVYREALARLRAR